MLQKISRSCLDENSTTGDGLSFFPLQEGSSAPLVFRKVQLKGYDIGGLNYFLPETGKEQRAVKIIAMKTIGLKK